jgi:cytochrome c oxidase subunit 4
MAHDTNSTHPELPHHLHAPVPIKTYATVLLILMGFMLLTIWVAVGLNIGNSLVNNLIAMAIACIKATLVILYFMDVRRGSQLTKIYAAMGFIFVTIMLIMLCDYATRQFEPTAGWDKGAKARWSQVNLPQVDPRTKERAHVPEGGGH